MTRFVAKQINRVTNRVDGVGTTRYSHAARNPFMRDILTET